MPFLACLCNSFLPSRRPTDPAIYTSVLESTMRMDCLFRIYVPSPDAHSSAARSRFRAKCAYDVNFLVGQVNRCLNRSSLAQFRTPKKAVWQLRVGGFCIPAYKLAMAGQIVKQLTSASGPVTKSVALAHRMDVPLWQEGGPGKRPIGSQTAWPGRGLAWAIASARRAGPAGVWARKRVGSVSSTSSTTGWPSKPGIRSTRA